MPQILELAHLVEQHGVANVQVRRGRIEAGLDSQRSTQGQARLHLFDLENFFGTATDHVERVLIAVHVVFLGALRCSKKLNRRAD
jgi:hypothetical protein